MHITVLHGPNLNLLGQRENHIYGNFTLQELENELRHSFPELTWTFLQSNEEGQLINCIQDCIQQQHPLIINPGGYSHTSVAIRDALTLLKQPKIEVHISNLYAREEFRHVSITGAVCDGVISGLEKKGYHLAVQAILLSLS